MTSQASKIDEWELGVIQDRYRDTHGITLTIDQAKQIYEYEQLRDTPSDKYYFSIWEEFHFEFATFQKILTLEQFEVYKVKHQELIHYNEEQHVQLDREYAKQLEAAKDLLQYYKDQLLPRLKTQLMIVGQAFIHDNEKVEFLKAEYKRYLDGRKKFILVEHFRHNKTLQPQLLQLSLLNHKLICLLPDYYSFRANMDAPTSVIAQYLERKLAKGVATILGDLKATLQSMEEFTKANTAKHLGEVKGWHVTMAGEEDNLMFMLLLDPEKYGC